MEFGTKLAQYRKRVNLTQVEFAKRVEITRQHLSEIEIDTHKPPKLRTILLMIGVLNLNTKEALDFLLETGQLPDVQSILDEGVTGKLAEQLEILEALAKVIEPLRKQIKEQKVEEHQHLADLIT